MTLKSHLINYKHDVLKHEFNLKKVTSCSSCFIMCDK